MMTKIKNILILFFITLPVIISAQENLTEYEEEMKLYMGETKVVSVDRPTRVVIGNPKIADVVGTSESAITLVAKATGKTTFVYWDAYGEHSYQVRVLAEDVNDIKKRIDAVLKDLNQPKAYTKANEEEDRVFLLGEVKTQKDKELIDLALGPLKAKTTDLIKIKEEGAVEINVMVLELNKDASTKLGLTWPTQSVLTEYPSTTAVSGSKLFHVSDWTRSALSATIDFLAQEGKARILSKLNSPA